MTWRMVGVFLFTCALVGVALVVTQLVMGKSVDGNLLVIALPPGVVGGVIVATRDHREQRRKTAARAH